jgi:hypothetical protein
MALARSYAKSDVNYGVKFFITSGRGCQKVWLGCQKPINMEGRKRRVIMILFSITFSILYLNHSGQNLCQPAKQFKFFVPNFFFTFYDEKVS